MNKIWRRMIAVLALGIWIGGVVSQIGHKAPATIITAWDSVQMTLLIVAVMILGWMAGRESSNDD